MKPETCVVFILHIDLGGGGAAECGGEHEAPGEVEHRRPGEGGEAEGADTTGAHKHQGPSTTTFLYMFCPMLCNHQACPSFLYF